jgi:ATP-dependent DNA ligase
MRVKNVCYHFRSAQPVEANRPPAGSEWVHEIKHDGYRLIVRRDSGMERLYTRKANDWTQRLPACESAPKFDPPPDRP